MKDLDPEEVECVAHRLFDANPPSQDDEWYLITEEARDYWRMLARAALCE